MKDLQTEVSATIDLLRRVLSKCEFVSTGWKASVYVQAGAVTIYFSRPHGKPDLDARALARAIGPDWKRIGQDWKHTPSDMPFLTIHIFAADTSFPSLETVEL